MERHWRETLRNGWAIQNGSLGKVKSYSLLPAIRVVIIKLKFIRIHIYVRTDSLESMSSLFVLVVLIIGIERRVTVACSVNPVSE
jgi:hypothetical protein